ncbi:hypothetical protein EBU71_23605, partial [bacterium]|nr:hypothetical protein [Candidatus Elulimicrobium humile]
FRYEDEIIDTSIEEIDDSINIDSNLQVLTLVSAGTTATAITSIVNGAVSLITVTNRGERYTSAPMVAISSSPSPGGTAVGIATLIDGLINCDGTDIGSKVQGVQIINPGFGYTVAPGIVFIGGGGSGAAATTKITNQAIGIITITNGGSGYTTTPSVIFNSPGIGTTAFGVAIVSSAGTINSIRVINAGSGYSMAPTITISSPNVIGIGTFLLNETIIGSQSGTKAIVKSWNVITGELNILNVTGNFIVGETITGLGNSASYKLKSIQTYNTVNQYPQNEEIEIEGDEILDFAESNPFGDP